jgi:hypothetical protein
MSARPADTTTAELDGRPGHHVPRPPEYLAVLRDLFSRLNAAEIGYCHWKSNQHLEASMTGATDVDVLFDRRHAQRLTRLLTENARFKRFVVKPGRGYPGIEDYVGFDEASGKLTHLHVHYQLTLGEKFLKGHRLPFEDLYLSTRVFDSTYGLYVADPHLEVVVLVVRAVMKLRARDSMLEALGRPYFGGGMLRELRWLAERTDPTRLLDVGTRLVGERAARLLPAMLAGKRPTVRQLRAFGRVADPALHVYRLYDGRSAVLQMAQREWSIIWWKLSNWYRDAVTRSTRTVPQGGLIISFLGADGAGKSTLTAAIANWLAPEVAVVTTYGGSGKGSASLPRRVLQRFAALRRWGVAASPPSRTPARAPSDRPRTGLRALAWVLSIMALTTERRRRAAQARRARGLGMIVLSDRLPQRQFPNLNDGPRLTHWLDAPPGLRRVLARREQTAFQLTELTPPDLVVKLYVSAEVATQRKPETAPLQLRNGLELVRQLRFPPTTRVLEVDADLPFPQVLRQVKEAVWTAI